MAYKGKTTCRILKDIRRQIAEANDIDLVIKECTYQGDCAGTCPRCEAEVAYLERELAKRRALGKAACITGIATSALLGMPAAAQTAVQTQDSLMVVEDERIVTDLVDLNTDTVDLTAIPAPGGVEDEGYDPVFLVVETMPSFPGGQDSLSQFLSANLKYPSEIQGEAHIECRVIVQFVVAKTGEIVDVEVVRSSGYEAFDREAVRVIKLMPKWIPGNQRGKAVNVQFTVPVRFKLAD